MEERRKENRVAEWKKQREEGGKREAIKTRLLALEMKRREGYVSCTRKISEYVRTRTQVRAWGLGRSSLQCRVISEGQGSRSEKGEGGE